jgi:hypothetical protein
LRDRRGPGSGRGCQRRRYQRQQLAEHLAGSGARSAASLIPEYAVDAEPDVGTHNSYNIQDDGYPFFQHSYTLTEQLRLGIRAINLDAHWLDDEQLHLSHANPDHLGASENDRLYEDGVAEIAAWLNANPDEVIIVEIENQADGHIAELVSPLEQYFGLPTDRIFRTSDTTLPVNWQNISPATVRAAGKNVIILCSEVPQNCVFSPDGFWNNPWPSNSVHRFYQRYAVGEVWLAGTFQQGLTSFSGDTSCIPFFHNGPDSIGVYSNRTVYDMVRAGVDMPTIEPFGLSHAYRPCNPFANYETNVDVLLEGAIWSWIGDPPVNNQPKAALTTIMDPPGVREHGAYLRGDVAPTESYRVAMQNSAGDWAITPQATSFYNAAALVSQYPGFSFTCPGNGFEMLRLQQALTANGLLHVWVNYSDTTGANQWTAVTQPRTNGAPTPLCPDEPFRRVPFDYDTISDAIADCNSSCNNLIIDGGHYPENPTFDKPMEIWVYYGVTIGN